MGCDTFLDDLCWSALSQNEAIPFQVLIVVIAFTGLAIVCDDHLVVSLETLCERWLIREDVAGVSFMAFGSAAPEIIINAVTTIKSLRTNDVNDESVELGVSAIIGSGMIAFLIIPGVCALSSGDRLLLKRRPLARDIFTYGLALLLLCLFFADGKIVLAEGATMLAVYALYLTLVVMAPRVRAHSRKKRGKIVRVKSFVEERRDRQLSAQEAQDDNDEDDDDDDDDSVFGDRPRKVSFDRPDGLETKLLGSGADDNDNDNDNDDGDDDDDEQQPGYWREDRRWSSKDSRGTHTSVLEDVHPWTAVQSRSSPAAAFRTALFYMEYFFGIIISAPLRFLFRWTCPDCAVGAKNERLFLLTFFVSFLWVALFSFVISTTVEVWVEDCGISGGFFGLFVIAIGAEIPDTIQSVTVAKRGYGSMAVANSTGSQIINILVGLGLPWTISALSGRVVKISGHDRLQIAAFFQLACWSLYCVLLLGASVAFFQRSGKAVLDKTKGKILCGAYVVAFAAYALYSFL